MNYVKLFLKLQDKPLYPKNCEFTEFEAYVDILMKSHPTGADERSLNEKAKAWGWDRNMVLRFMTKLCEMRVLSKSDGGRYVVLGHENYYGLPKQNDELAKRFSTEVLECYNQTFDRAIKLNDYRQRTIWARFREGQGMEPKVGLEQFKRVFLYKKSEWENTDMARYLEIETLCARKHFFKYLDQAREAHRKASGPGETRMQGSITKKQ